jgi:hypothetical protein
VLNEIVRTDKSGNTKKELKKMIYENVSTLRNLIVKLKEKLEEETRQRTNGQRKQRSENRARCM